MKQAVISVLIAVILLSCAYPSFAVTLDSGQYLPSVEPNTPITVWIKGDQYGSAPEGKQFVYISHMDSQLNYDDALYLDSTDPVGVPGGLFFTRYINANHTTDVVTVEAKVRLDSYIGTAPGQCAISVSDDTALDVITIWPDHISLYMPYGGGAQYSYSMNTMDNYHTYKLVTGNGQIAIYVDTNPIPVITAPFIWHYSYDGNLVNFGDLASYAGAKSSWAYVKYKVERN